MCDSLALPLAFIGLARERQDRRREQVGKVGAWCGAQSWPEKPEERMTFLCQVHVRNGSELPVTVSGLRLRWQGTWANPVPVGAYYSPRPMPSQDPMDFWDAGVVVAPTSTETGQRAYTPSIPTDAVILNMSVVVTEFTVIDNAGRVWLVRPQSAGTARQIATGRLWWLHGRRPRPVAIDD